MYRDAEEGMEVHGEFASPDSCRWHIDLGPSGLVALYFAWSFQYMNVPLIPGFKFKKSH